MPDNQIQMLEGLSQCGCNASRSRYSERLAGLDGEQSTGQRLLNVLGYAAAFAGAGYLLLRHTERRREAGAAKERAMSRFLNNTERMARQSSSRTRRGR